MPAGWVDLNYGFQANFSGDSQQQQQSDPDVQLPGVTVSGSAISGGSDASFYQWQSEQLQQAWNSSSQAGQGGTSVRQSSPPAGPQLQGVTVSATRGQQTKPTTQSTVCEYASSNPDSDQLAEVASALGLDDNLVQAIEKANPSVSLPGFLGEAAPTVLSGAATGAAVGIIAGEVRQGQYLNASLDSMDLGLGLYASRAGGRFLLADTAFNMLGGFKQLAKDTASVICKVSGGN